MFANVDRHQARRLARRIGAALLALSMAGCSAGKHREPSTPPAPARLQLPQASGPVLSVVNYPFTAQGVEAGRGLALPEYFSPPPGTSNVYLVLEVKGTFAKGARDTPGPLDGVFDFHAPECTTPGTKRTNCGNVDISLNGGLVFLTREQTATEPGALFRHPANGLEPPQLQAGVPYYTLVAEAIPTNVPLKDITFCSDKKCLPLAGLPAMAR